MPYPTERLFRDAADCHAAVENGEVVLRDSGDYLKIARVEQAAGGDPTFFGEDDPEDGMAWNGVCNDSRFMADPRHPAAVEYTALRQKGDATDCRRAFLMRHAWVLEDVETPAGGLRTIAFGDDSGRWTLDGECDDPRFVDPKTGRSGDELLRDSTDCRAAYIKGDAWLLEDLLRKDEDLLPAGFDLGDDSGPWTFDGECDDPRFTGAADSGRTGMPDAHGLERDATDCGHALLHDAAGIRPHFLERGHFGEDGPDSGMARNGVCNDSRFVADPRYPKAVSSSEGLQERDATDCRLAFLLRQAWMLEEVATPDGGSRWMAFGDDSGRWTFDGACDDPRFLDPRIAASGDALLRDAADCRAAYVKGDVLLLEDVLKVKELLPDGFDLGDDSGRWALDEVCDDPRFLDPRMDPRGHFDPRVPVRPYTPMRDALDCGQALAQGKIELLWPGILDWRDSSDLIWQDGMERILQDDIERYWRGGIDELPP